MGQLSGRERYRVLTGLVVPRPIAWVSTLSREGVRNLAPHSYCSIVSPDPPVIQFTSTGVKDSFRNVTETGEFVLNIVSEDLARQMNITAADLPSEEDEFVWADLEWTASERVKPPRVAAAPAAFECSARRTLEVGAGMMAFGDVLAVHVAADVWQEAGVDYEALGAVGRLGGPLYVSVTRPWTMERVSFDDLHGVPDGGDR